MCCHYATANINLFYWCVICKFLSNPTFIQLISTTIAENTGQNGKRENVDEGQEERRVDGNILRSKRLETVQFSTSADATFSVMYWRLGSPPVEDLIYLF